MPVYPEELEVKETWEDIGFTLKEFINFYNIRGCEYYDLFYKAVRIKSITYFDDMKEVRVIFDGNMTLWTDKPELILPLKNFYFTSRVSASWNEVLEDMKKFHNRSDALWK